MPRKAKPAIERFNQRYAIDSETGCWNWTKALNPKGYGRFWMPDSDFAHQFAYAYFIGPIPEGMEVHHKCRNRRCVNPKHLEVKTHADHCLEDFRKDQCSHGHPFVEGSFYEYFERGRSHRQCRICAIERSSAYHEQNKESHNAKCMARYFANWEANKAKARQRYHDKKAAAVAKQQQP